MDPARNICLAGSLPCDTTSVLPSSRRPLVVARSSSTSKRSTHIAHNFRQTAAIAVILQSSTLALRPPSILPCFSRPLKIVLRGFSSLIFLWFWCHRPGTASKLLKEGEVSAIFPRVIVSVQTALILCHFLCYCPRFQIVS